MHSKIIQIESAPIALSERISPDYYYDHWFLSSVADYVDVDEGNSVDDLIQLFKSVCGNEVEAFSDENGVGLIFKDGFVRTFMEREYQQYDAALRSLVAESTFDAFCDNKLAQPLFALDNAYSDEYGIYIQTDDGLKTLNDFIRSVRFNHRYYFGGTVDYHA